GTAPVPIFRLTRRFRVLKMSKPMEDKETKPSPEPSELEKTKAERDEYLAGWQRAKADAMNARKRMEEDMKAFRALANEGLIEELLPVLQSFEMAFANKEAWEKADKNWRAGVEYIYTQLKSVLDQHGLKAVDPQGQPFDHAQHEAVSYEKAEGVAEGSVI